MSTDTLIRYELEMLRHLTDVLAAYIEAGERWEPPADPSRFIELGDAVRALRAFPPCMWWTDPPQKVDL